MSKKGASNGFTSKKSCNHTLSVQQVKLKESKVKRDFSIWILVLYSVLEFLFNT